MLDADERRERKINRLMWTFEADGIAMTRETAEKAVAGKHVSVTLNELACEGCEYVPGCEQCPSCQRCLLYCKCDGRGVEP